MTSIAHTYFLDPRTDILADHQTGEQIPLSKAYRGRPVVAVDPGHGVMKRMKRGGAIYDVGCDTVTGSTESVITQKMSIEIAKELNARGVDVIITHDSSRQNAGDGFDFRNHAARAADAFVAIHVNSANNANASGPRIYSNRATAPGDALRAAIAARHVADHMYDDRARRENHDVTRPSHVGDTPAILVELGFGSNRRDSLNLNSSAWRAQVARELATDIHAFLTSPVTVQDRAQSPQRERLEEQREREDTRPVRRSNAHPGMHILHHDIEKGDTYYRLSQVYNVSVADLQQVNHNRVPRVGEEVIIPSVRSFTVDEHDSAYSIARGIAATDGAEGVTPSEVIALMRKLNPELKDISSIKPDDELIVPTDAKAVRHMQKQISTREQ